MSFFKIQIDLQNERYKSLVEEFYLQQNLMNALFNKLENFANDNSNDPILIKLKTKNDISEIKDINELSLQFWFRFNIQINSYTAYIVLSEDTNGIHEISHQRLKLLSPIILKLYENFDIENIISQFATFVKTAQKIKKIQKEFLNVDFKFKAEYVKKFLKKHFLNTEDSTQLTFSFTKSTSYKAFLNYSNSSNPLISIKVPEEHTDFYFSKEKYTLDDFKILNQKIFDFFPEDFFKIEFKRYNDNPYGQHFKIRTNYIDIDYIYEKAKLYTELKNF